MVCWQYNDGGRSLSKRSRQKNDCAVRACAIALSRSYDDVYDEMAVLGRKSGTGTSPDITEKVLGLRERMTFPAVKGKPRMNVQGFVAKYRQGTFIVHTAKHLFCVRDGVVLDTFEPEESRCVYKAWRIE